jgi:hypothetical protein
VSLIALAAMFSAAVSLPTVSFAVRRVMTMTVMLVLKEEGH